MNLNPCLISNTKSNFTWITDIIVQAKTIKLLKENIRQNICKFLNRTLKILTVKKDKLKLQKAALKNINKQATAWEKNIHIT